MYKQKPLTFLHTTTIILEEWSLPNAASADKVVRNFSTVTFLNRNVIPRPLHMIYTHSGVTLLCLHLSLRYVSAHHRIDLRAAVHFVVY